MLPATALCRWLLIARMTWSWQQRPLRPFRLPVLLCGCNSCRSPTLTMERFRLRIYARQLIDCAWTASNKDLCLTVKRVRQSFLKRSDDSYACRFTDRG